MANIPGSSNQNIPRPYYEQKPSNGMIVATTFSRDMQQGANHLDQFPNAQIMPQVANRPFLHARGAVGVVRHQAYWMPQQQSQILPGHAYRPSNAPNTSMMPNSYTLPSGNVVFVRPLGLQPEAQQGTSSAPGHSKPQSMQYAGSEVALRGLSPLKNNKPTSYPSYVDVNKNDEGSESNPGKVGFHCRPIQQNGFLITDIKSQAVSHADGKSVTHVDIAAGLLRFNEAGPGSSTHGRRVRMGWNPSKRKRPNEKPSTPPAVLVISSDEEEPDKKEIRPAAQEGGARICFKKSQSKNPVITETTRNIAERLPQPDSGSDSGRLNTLNYGLSLLDKPQRILDVLEEVLRERPTRLRVNLKNLYHNAKTGCLSKVLSMLLEEVSPASPLESEDGKSALHAAASKGHLDVLVVLTFKAVGDIDVTDKFKRTPLFIAVEKGQVLAAQFLQKAGASLQTKNFEGMSLMHVAAHKGNTKMLEWLLAQGLEVNEQDKGGWTSLMWAAEEGKSDTLKILIDRGAKGDLRDKEMNTCLHWAAITGTVQGCEDLLEIRCDINAVNMYGDTPLHISAREGNHDIVKLFLLRGADTSIRNNDNKLPMDVCVNNQQVRDAIRLRHAIGHVRLKRQYDCDMARGKERIAVSCINEVDDEPLPLGFTYISEVVESSTVNIMKDLLTVKGCKCNEDCSKTFCECIRSNESGRCWFNNGILDAEFLEIDQPVLVECSKLCRCWSYCSNRVVQRGMQFPLEVFKTTNIGWGLRTIVAIPKGSFVLNYVGEVISDDEAERRSDDSYLFDLDMKDSTDEDKCLDARVFGNCGRFINHSCDANLVPVRVFTHHRDWRFPGIAFFTYRDVGAYEELCFDYGNKFWEIKKKHGMRCQCKSSNCIYG